jgi:phenylacetate-CoA ligase
VKAGERDLKWFRKWRADLQPDPIAAQTFAFQERLLSEQDRPPARMTQMRDHLLHAMLAHAQAQVPHYRRLLAGQELARLKPGTPEWAALPILHRADVQATGPALRADHLPEGHRVAATLRSSGSTGQPVEVQTTDIAGQWQRALALRAAVWARRDFTGSLAVIRRFRDAEATLPEGATADCWSDATGFPVRTGKRFLLDALAGTTSDQFAWLCRKAPAYVMTYPSILRDLVELAAADRPAWRPRGVLSIGESVDDALRDRVRAVWGIGIDDVYSAEECGVIAIQCPSHGRYHIQTETVLVEVVDAAGAPLPPGQPGQVLVTTLANPAMPLIRYAIGDHAVAGSGCGCGRAGPVLTKVLGRERNLMVTPTGRFWPSFGTRRFQKIAPITAQQFRQTAPDRIEMLFVCARPLTPDEAAALTEAIAAALPVPMGVTLTPVAEIPRNASGKTEIFLRSFDQDGLVGQENGIA